MSGSGFAGIGLADSTLSLFNNTVVTASSNGVRFFLAAGSKVAAPDFSGATFVLHNNGAGIRLVTGSSMLITAGLNVHDNAVGIQVDEEC